MTTIPDDKELIEIAEREIGTANGFNAFCVVYAGAKQAAIRESEEFDKLPDEAKRRLAEYEKRHDVFFVPETVLPWVRLRAPGETIEEIGLECQGQRFFAWVNEAGEDTSQPAAGKAEKPGVWKCMCAFQVYANILAYNAEWQAESERASAEG